MKERAQTLAYGQYKKEKRELAKHEAKKKLMWIMSVVKCKHFVNKITYQWKENRERRLREEAEI